MTTYFAYGSNMNVSQMARRCPSAACRGNACLAGHDFLINQRGFGTIVPDSQSTVHGLLWTLSDPDIASLDEYEGIAVGYYRKEHLAVSFAGETIVAMIYVATDSSPGIPEPAYIELIVAAATARGLSTDYVRRLAKWLPPAPS
jgi:gamma-glutamylcyclotransferase (GGCT)/AIG2-like uncharacterized protein YtfP